MPAAGLAPFVIWILALLPGLVWGEERVTPAGVAYIDALISQVVQTHPKVEAERERSQAALAAIRSVRLWEDPQLGLGLTAARRSMRMDDGDIRIGLEQMLPRPGLYKAETRRASAEHQMQESMGLLTANELGLSVAQTVLELALADDVIRLQADDLRWLDTMVKTAIERAKNPEGSAAESLRLEGELALRGQKLAAAQRQRAQIAGTLNILLGRNSQDGWKPLTLAGEIPASQSLAALEAQLKQNNPQLSATRFKVQGAQAE